MAALLLIAIAVTFGTGGNGKAGWSAGDVDAARRDSRGGGAKGGRTPSAPGEDGTRRATSPHTWWPFVLPVEGRESGGRLASGGGV